MILTIHWCRLWGSLLIWLSTYCCLSTAFETKHCRTTIDLGATLSNQQPGAILATLDWGWESRLIDSAPAEQQRTADSCGPAALRRIFKNGVSVDDTVANVANERAPEQLARQLDATLTTKGLGCTLGEIGRAATRLGLRAQFLVARDLQEITPPAILHLRRGHFVVLEGRTRDFVRVFDPACGVIRARASRLHQQWSGAALQFARTDHDRAVAAVRP